MIWVALKLVSSQLWMMIKCEENLCKLWKLDKFQTGNMLSSGNPGDQGSLHGSNIVQYGQDGSVVNYVPGNSSMIVWEIQLFHWMNNPFVLVNLVGGNVIAEDQSRKREMRLLKNREAARECRRKKKEYIKCLENRVAVLENQNKALIEELKSLKELYCQQKNDWDETSSEP